MNRKLLIGIAIFLGLATSGFGFLLWKFNAAAETDETANSVAVGVYLGLGESAMEAHLYGVAETSFGKALALARLQSDNDTNCAEALTRIGQCSLKQGQTDKALNAFKQASELYAKAESAADGIPLFSVDKRIYLKCLNEYAKLLKESGRDKEANKFTATIERLSKDLGPLEKFRQSTTEL